MAISSTGPTESTSDWGSDFFGALNEMPSEPVIGMSHVLEAMSTPFATRAIGYCETCQWNPILPPRWLLDERRAQYTFRYSWRVFLS